MQSQGGSRSVLGLGLSLGIIAVDGIVFEVVSVHGEDGIRADWGPKSNATLDSHINKSQPVELLDIIAVQQTSLGC